MFDSCYTPFSESEDNEIRKWISRNGALCLEMGWLVADGINRDLHLVIQRAFQLDLIRYSQFSPFLLSHRREGWRSDEIDLLITNRCVSRKLLARALNRSPSAVSKQMYCLKLMSGGHDYDWKEAEKQFLLRNCKNQTIGEICQHLNRHAIDVKHQSIKIRALLAKAGEEFTRGGLGKREITPLNQGYKLWPIATA